MASKNCEIFRKTVQGCGHDNAVAPCSIRELRGSTTPPDKTVPPWYATRKIPHSAFSFAKSSEGEVDQPSAMRYSVSTCGQLTTFHHASI